MLAIIPVTFLILPFVIAYNQMSTVFIVQGSAMRSLGVIDASVLNNVDPISVLVFGSAVASYLYPALAKRGITLAATTKFSIGTAFGALAIVSSLIIDYVIHDALSSGTTISAMWQIFSYMFVGNGEIFSFAASMEIAFKLAPKE